MRIIHVQHSHILGGVERHVLQMLCLLRDAGHAVCFAGPPDGWLGRQCIAQGIECLDLAMHGMYDLASALKLTRFARRWNADLLHGHAQRGTRYAVWAAKWSGRVAVATAHSTNADSRFAGAQRLICVSDAVRDFLVTRGWPRARLIRIHAGVADLAANAPSRDDARAALGLSDDALVLGMVARFVQAKGHEIAVDALARLRHRDAVLLLAGADDNAVAAAVRARAAKLGVSARLRFLGECRDVAPVFAACDMVLAPSHREALSLSLIEAAAMSLPIVATRVGGIPEVVEHDVNGLLVDDGDHAALAAAIDELADDPVRQWRLGAAGRRRFQQRFGLEPMREAVEGVYRDVLPSMPLPLSSGAPA
ncbi:glycosyltransferase family 4 protein [Solimonas marina]|nr:glycosyltransferase family 4 protein [Solimonas marina]